MAHWFNNLSEALFARLLGRSGGQTLIGGTDSGDDLTLQSTSNATKGNIYLGSTTTVSIDETNKYVGIGIAAPAYSLDISNTTAIAHIHNTASAADTALTRTMTGVELAAVGMNTTNCYTPAIKFLSSDTAFTTESPKLLAAIVGRATEIYGADTDSGMAIDFATSADNVGAANVPVVRMSLWQGLQMGAPTGGDKGAGTINCAADIYKNNTAYTNPDYVFEHYYTGRIDAFAANEGADTYQGLMPLEEVERFAKDHHHLPRISRESAGVFERADMLLEHIESLYLYAFQQNERIKSLEARLAEKG